MGSSAQGSGGLSDTWDGVVSDAQSDVQREVVSNARRVAWGVLPGVVPWGVAP